MKKLHIFFCFLTVVFIGFIFCAEITDNVYWIWGAVLLILLFKLEEDEALRSLLSSFFWCLLIIELFAIIFRRPLEIGTGYLWFCIILFALYWCQAIKDTFRVFGSMPKMGVQKPSAD